MLLDYYGRYYQDRTKNIFIILPWRENRRGYKDAAAEKSLLWKKIAVKLPCCFGDYVPLDFSVTEKTRYFYLC